MSKLCTTATSVTYSRHQYVNSDAFSVFQLGCEVGWRVALVGLGVHGGTAAVKKVEGG